MDGLNRMDEARWHDMKSSVSNVSSKADEDTVIVIIERSMNGRTPCTLNIQNQLFF